MSVTKISYRKHVLFLSRYILCVILINDLVLAKHSSKEFFWYSLWFSSYVMQNQTFSICLGRLELESLNLFQMSHRHHLYHFLAMQQRLVRLWNRGKRQLWWRQHWIWKQRRCLQIILLKRPTVQVYSTSLCKTSFER